MSFTEWINSNPAYAFLLVLFVSSLSGFFNGVLDRVLKRIKERKNKQE